MTQSGQGEEPSAREAREGIVLPSDGGEPLLPGMLGGQPGHHAGHVSGPYNAPAPASAPPGGQAWGTPWGPEQPQYEHQSPAPQPGQGWSAPPAEANPPVQQWAAPEASQPLPAEGGPAQSYGGHSAPLPPAAPGAGQSMPLPPVVDEGATQYIPPVTHPEGATQYLPPVAAADQQATQYIPPFAPGALPPEAGPDAQATQYIPPVTDQGAGAPYGMPQGGDRQPPAEFDNLFRSGPDGGSPAGATQFLPRFEEQYAPGPSSYAQQPPQTSYAPTGPSYAPQDDGGRGGRSKSRVPFIAAVGVGIVVLGVGAGALLAGGGGDSDGGDKNQPVSATAPATGGSGSPAADAAKQQAVALDKLLADSGDSRASVIGAVGDVRGCRNLDTAASDLRDAAKQRADLVTRLSGLSVDKLADHAALTTALTKAWQASAAADNHYAGWADQVAGDKKLCKKGQARATGQTLAGNRASGTASKQKVRAAQLWNAIARTYGLTQRQPTQL